MYWSCWPKKFSNAYQTAYKINGNFTTPYFMWKSAVLYCHSQVIFHLIFCLRLSEFHQLAAIITLRGDHRRTAHGGKGRYPHMWVLANTCILIFSLLSSHNFISLHPSSSLLLFTSLLFSSSMFPVPKRLILYHLVSSFTQQNTATLEWVTTLQNS